MFYITKFVNHLDPLHILSIKLNIDILRLNYLNTLNVTDPLHSSQEFELFHKENLLNTQNYQGIQVSVQIKHFHLIFQIYSFPFRHTYHHHTCYPYHPFHILHNCSFLHILRVHLHIHLIQIHKYFQDLLQN